MTNDEQNKAAELPEYGWVRFDEHKPAKHANYLVTNSFYSVRIAYYFGSTWDFDDHEPIPDDWGLTHWSYLPAPLSVKEERSKKKSKEKSKGKQTHFTEELMTVVNQFTEVLKQFRDYEDKGRQIHNDLDRLVDYLWDITEEQIELREQEKESKS